MTSAILPVTGHESRLVNGSTAADCDHNLEPVAVSKLLIAEQAARDDLAVALERDALSGELELFDQLLAAERSGELARFAIDGDGNHEETYCPPMPILDYLPAQAFRTPRAAVPDTGAPRHAVESGVTIRALNQDVAK